VTEEINDLIASVSLNQILIAILNKYEKVSIPTSALFDAGNTEKELVIDYDDEGPSFIIKLRNKEHVHDDGIPHSHD